ncbi:MAG TPA: aldo/keto reductase [Beijerinckiaceae bacterium]|nr:aldo/keto reductase [Beijerinckiaceae bacterium]
MADQRTRLHPDGPELSRIVWGAWQVLMQPELGTPAGLAEMIVACLDHGITSFDHADVYGSFTVEARFGEALKLWGGARHSIEIISKCGNATLSPQRPETRVKHYNTSAAHIAASVDRSLANFGTDYLDLLLIHRPDPFMDADDTAAGLEAVVRAGKVRAVGVSNFTPQQVSLLQSRLSMPLVTNQIQFSLLHLAPLDDGTLDQAQERRMAPMLWSPLAKGRLFREDSPVANRVREALGPMAARYGVEQGALALAWLMAHPARPVPVIGTSSVARIASLAKAEGLHLDRQDCFTLLEAARGAPAP